MAEKEEGDGDCAERVRRRAERGDVSNSENDRQADRSLYKDHQSGE